MAEDAMQEYGLKEKNGNMKRDPKTCFIVCKNWE